jgi:hypothetical protein
LQILDLLIISSKYILNLIDLIDKNIQFLFIVLFHLFYFLFVLELVLGKFGLNLGIFLLKIYILFFVFYQLDLETLDLF